MEGKTALLPLESMDTAPLGQLSFSAGSKLLSPISSRVSLADLRTLAFMNKSPQYERNHWYHQYILSSTNLSKFRSRNPNLQTSINKDHCKPMKQSLLLSRAKGRTTRLHVRWLINCMTESASSQQYKNAEMRG